MEQGREKRKYLPKKKFYLTIEQLKQLDELKKQRSEIMTVDVERELKLYSPEASPLDSVRLPPLAAIGLLFIVLYKIFQKVSGNFHCLFFWLFENS